MDPNLADAIIDVTNHSDCRIPYRALTHRFDTDNSGSLDKSELASAFEAVGRPSDEETIEKAIQSLDTDGDVSQCPSFASLLAVLCLGSSLVLTRARALH